MSERKLPQYTDVDGFRLCSAFSPEIFRDAVKYKPLPDDLFIVTYPKCGTTWMQNIVYLICHEGEPPKSSIDYIAANPFLEAMGVESTEWRTGPGAIKTHLPFHLQPYSQEAKYIYVVRNPKDCCVSFYHHTESADDYGFKGGDFNDFFDLFLNGETDYGDYFDHVLSWYEHRNDPNVLVLTYEEMKSDTPRAIRKVAEFMGEKYAESVRDQKVMDAIDENSSVQKMKETTNNFVKDFFLPEKMDQDKIPETMKRMLEKMTRHSSFASTEEVRFNIVRKGIVGDWRNVFTAEQNQNLDEKMKNRLGDTDWYKYWKETGAI